MIKKFYLTLFILIAISTLLIFVSCSKDTTDEAPRPQVADTPDVSEELAEPDPDALMPVVQSLTEEFPDIAEKAEELIETIDRNSRLSRPGKENAWVYLYMASAYQEDSTIAAGLNAMRNSFSGRETQLERNERMDERFVKTVMHHLHSNNGLILSNAIDAAVHGLTADEQVQEIVDRLVAIANDTRRPAARYEVLSMLFYSTTLEESPEQMNAYIKALDAGEPYVVSIALTRMYNIAKKTPDTDAVKKKLIELLKHDDGGVRGRSAQVLGAFVGSRADDRDEIAKLIIPLLEDENNYAKSMAFYALKDLDYRPAIHLIMTHLDDDSSNTHRIDFTKLDGTSGWEHHDASSWSKVNDAALTAFRLWSRDLGEAMDFRIRSSSRDEDTANAIKAVNQWYESIKDDIPQP